MKFGKLLDISGVNFDLPPDYKGTTTLLESLPKQSALPTVYVGCTGWSTKEWLGSVYPRGTKPKDYLKHYAKQFNTIEFNTTHYRAPSLESIEKWKQESTEDFKFCPKLLQTISHSKELAFGTQKLESFCEAIQHLDEKLGCSFMQLPPFFSYDRLAILEDFLKRFPPSIRLAIELRHENWFNDNKRLQTLMDLLQAYKVAAVITDVAGRRDVLHQAITTDIAMVRFVGNALDPTDYSRIDEWVQRLKQWFEKGLSTVYFFTHEPDNILAPQLAAYFVEQLELHCAVSVRGPNLLVEEASKQISLF